MNSKIIDYFKNNSINNDDIDDLVLYLTQLQAQRMKKSLFADFINAGDLKNKIAEDYLIFGFDLIRNGTYQVTLETMLELQFHNLARTESLDPQTILELIIIKTILPCILTQNLGDFVTLIEEFCLSEEKKDISRQIINEFLKPSQQFRPPNLKS